MTENEETHLPHGPLGRETTYADSGHDASLLHAMPRRQGENLIVSPDAGEIVGQDVWNGYEFSWLDDAGLPQIAHFRMTVASWSSSLIESKSLKLYLNSFAQSAFSARHHVQELLERDLNSALLNEGREGDTRAGHAEPASSSAEGEIVASTVAGVLPATIELLPNHAESLQPTALPGKSLDGHAQSSWQYERVPSTLRVRRQQEPQFFCWHSDLFRSLCPVTGQPDWASIVIQGHGGGFEPDTLLAYLVSYRQHQAFHESTIELIFSDLLNLGDNPELMVSGYFLRRGGIDINPWRGSAGCRPPEPLRTWRQ